MKEKAKHFMRNFCGIIIPILSIVLCLIYDELPPSFNFLWLNLLLPFYLFFINCLFRKKEKHNVIFDILFSILIIVVSYVACILFVYSRYTYFYNSEYNFIDFEMRFFKYKELIFMMLFSIGIFLIMMLLFMLKQNTKSGKSKNIIALTTTCVFTIALLLNHFGLFSLYERNQCENLCRTILCEIFNTHGKYDKCDTALKNNISEDLYKAIYSNYTSYENTNYEETYEFDCVRTEFIFNKAKVWYTYSYQQTDKENGKLVFGSAADGYKQNVMTMEKINDRWIVTNNYLNL